MIAWNAHNHTVQDVLTSLRALAASNDNRCGLDFSMSRMYAMPSLQDRHASFATSSLTSLLALLALSSGEGDSAR